MISIIVPVYNIEKYLETCIDSILSQTYQDYELLLVDDASTDGSGEICDRYAARDMRIRVIHNVHSGASGSRNKGMKEARGAYVYFADGDDYLAPDILERLLGNLESAGADISICGFSRTNEDGKPRPNLFAHIQKKRVFSYRKGMRDLLSLGGYSSFLWNKLFRRDLLEGILFPLNRCYEDMAVVYQIFHRAEKIVYDPFIGYFYRQRKSSTLHQMNLKKNQEYKITVLELTGFVKSNYPEYSFWADYFVFRMRLSLLSFRLSSFFKRK